MLQLLLVLGSLAFSGCAETMQVVKAGGTVLGTASHVLFLLQRVPDFYAFYTRGYRYEMVMRDHLGRDMGKSRCMPKEQAEARARAVRAQTHTQQVIVRIYPCVHEMPDPDRPGRYKRVRTYP